MKAVEDVTDTAKKAKEAQIEAELAKLRAKLVIEAEKQPSKTEPSSPSLLSRIRGMVSSPMRTRPPSSRPFTQPSKSNGENGESSRQ